MIPLVYATPYADYQVRRVTGAQEMKNHLSHLGFVSGASISLLKKIDDSYIVTIKNSRVALSEDLARRIMISDEGGSHEHTKENPCGRHRNRGQTTR